MNGLLAQVLQSPRLVEFQGEIDRTLSSEQAARRQFRATVDEDRRGEFVNGVVIEAVSTQDQHTVCLHFLATLVTTFVRMRKLGSVRTEQALTEFPRNDYCPDLCFWRAATDIGSNPKQVVYPPPDFVIEVLSPGTQHRDRGVKFDDYEAHGVKEYWIVDPEARTIEQFVEDAGKYHRLFAGSDGVVKSVVIPAFEMPIVAAFDDAAQMQALQAMLRNA
jgi:Uma2 family endonuclease